MGWAILASDFIGRDRGTITHSLVRVQSSRETSASCGAKLGGLFVFELDLLAGKDDPADVGGVGGTGHSLVGPGGKSQKKQDCE